MRARKASGATTSAVVADGRRPGPCRRGIPCGRPERAGAAAATWYAATLAGWIAQDAAGGAGRNTVIAHARARAIDMRRYWAGIPRLLRVRNRGIYLGMRAKKAFPGVGPEKREGGLKGTAGADRGEQTPPTGQIEREGGCRRRGGPGEGGCRRRDGLNEGRRRRLGGSSGADGGADKKFLTLATLTGFWWYIGIGQKQRRTFRGHLRVTVGEGGAWALHRAEAPRLWPCI